MGKGRANEGELKSRRETKRNVVHNIFSVPFSMKKVASVANNVSLLLLLAFVPKFVKSNNSANCVCSAHIKTQIDHGVHCFDSQDSRMGNCLFSRDFKLN